MALLIKRNWVFILTVLGLELVIELAFPGMAALKSSPLAIGVTTMLASVVGIFLVFRFNEAYARWWEARTLWGELVNSSRTLARQTLTLITPEVLRIHGEAEQREAKQELIHRQIAYLYALGHSLRDQPPLEGLGSLLPPQELEELEASSNVPTQMMLRQGMALRALLGSDTPQVLVRHQIDATLSRITTSQGGCERIKRTAFPDSVSAMSRVLVWGIGLSVPVAFLNPESTYYVPELLAVLFTALSFLVVQQLGHDLKNPFENTANDTPVTSLARTVEIDLREMLGEADIPYPVRPQDGVLM